MSSDTASRLFILIFIILFVIVGTFIEFKKPKKEKKDIDKSKLNKTILDSIKEEDNENINI